MLSGINTRYRFRIKCIFASMGINPAITYNNNVLGVCQTIADAILHY